MHQAISLCLSLLLIATAGRAADQPQMAKAPFSAEQAG